MRAKERAMTADAPDALIAIGACSREEPQPKFFPATMKSPEATFDAKEASMSSMQWRASSAGSEVFRYRAGMMTSVSTSSPYFHALPFISMSPGLDPRAHGSSAGPPILPTSAEAAATAGLERYTSLSGCP